MSEHTPGPWNKQWIYGALRHINKNVDDDSFYFPFEGDEAFTVPDVRINPGDAALIAAAPDLLEAAKLTALHFERMNLHPDVNFMGDDEHEAWGALNRAIAKAEGR
jgi:hypothetical protein